MPPSTPSSSLHCMRELLPSITPRKEQRHHLKDPQLSFCPSREKRNYPSNNGLLTASVCVRVKCQKLYAGVLHRQAAARRVKTAAQKIFHNNAPISSPFQISNLVRRLKISRRFIRFNIHSLLLPFFSALDSTH